MIEDRDLRARCRTDEPGLRTAAAADCSPSGAPPRSCRTPRSTGTPNAPRGCSSTAIGSAADEERMKRAVSATIPRDRRTRASIAWCIVGTAVYQVGCSRGAIEESRPGGIRGCRRSGRPRRARRAAPRRARGCGRAASRSGSGRRGSALSVVGDVSGGSDQVPLGQRHELRPRCRSGGVKDERDVVGAAQRSRAAGLGPLSRLKTPAGASASRSSSSTAIPRTWAAARTGESRSPRRRRHVPSGRRDRSPFRSAIAGLRGAQIAAQARARNDVAASGPFWTTSATRSLDLIPRSLV